MKLTKIFTLFVIMMYGTFALAQNGKMFFKEANKFFEKYESNGTIDYAAAKNSPMLDIFAKDIANVNLDAFDANTRKAYLINAYNLLVINKITKAYPISSVQDIDQFFDRSDIVVAGKKYSLNQFEKELILGKNPDPRLHFVLVCGAVGCPPIIGFAYTADKLESQLDAQTKIALNNSAFLVPRENQVAINKIFEWYTQDFGANKQERIAFINKYRNSKISPTAKFNYLDYDWSINETGANTGQSTTISANSARYVVSSTIPKGSVELKLFNNLYTQRSNTDFDTGSRSNFFTSTFSALYGVNKRFNAGLELKYRRVSNGNLPSSPLTVFGENESVTSSRNGITGIGPKIRWAPTSALPNFSVQSTFQFPVGDGLEGINDKPFIDWNGAIWYTQLFNDFSIGNNFSLFTELDFWIEDIGNGEEGFSNIFSTPVSLIFSYFPNPKTTVYALGSYSPKFVEGFDYFYQYGVGTKYQFNPNFELELLISDFTSKFLVSDNGQAATFNLGIRYNL